MVAPGLTAARRGRSLGADTSREVTMFRTLMLAGAALALCAGGALAQPAATPDNVARAVADAGRTPEDKARDAARKPAEMLAFAGVRPGDKVAELLPGGGYFTRVLSPAVGPTGKVYTAVQAAELEKATAAAKGNVTPLAYTGPGFKTPEPVDMVFTAQNYHDLHLKRLNLDVPAANKALFEALKPGGVLIIIDHAAATGAPVEIADTLHRIDPAIVKKEVEAAGFTFVAQSDAVRNPADDHAKPVFDPAIRGHTDQFVYKFRKPG
jgi:predicted methyltransferase